MSTSFERPSAASSRQNSTSSNSSTLSKTWKKIKEHHDGMNDAFATYYGGGRRSQEAWNTASPRGSVTYVEGTEHEPLVEKKSLAKKMLGRVKEHHRSVNAAYRAYYG
ncbi:hypothetical protein DPSP01_009731 [Paraphaeosphaeria sporulosa]|uniref:Uncharacterized protein n=1 Tax=Paraphaeosphaeria sporulosa TaxID=1460663 RepID=A0A177CE18_9PLEO|nr:uncharacterized protein CC84DRAFT_1218371 [Paraphaeosphaeria sporulosa]OAG04970.1 hypothetical protein CC84DRAFT_1218371 [Paraphaeosphaeria sporulosa]